MEFQSTFPYGSDCSTCALVISRKISIHAPLRERQAGLPAGAAMTPISIHAPLRERQQAGYTVARKKPFQSSLPYGSDFASRSASSFSSSISIHAPLRERLRIPTSTLDHTLISIHAPLRERLTLAQLIRSYWIFQSTLPYGSDRCAGWESPRNAISIHAPLRERRCF